MESWSVAVSWSSALHRKRRATRVCLRQASQPSAATAVCACRRRAVVPHAASEACASRACALEVRAAPVALPVAEPGMRWTRKHPARAGALAEAHAQRSTRHTLWAPSPLVRPTRRWPRAPASQRRVSGVCACSRRTRRAHHVPPLRLTRRPHWQRRRSEGCVALRRASRAAAAPPPCAAARLRRTSARRRPRRCVAKRLLRAVAAQEHPGAAQRRRDTSAPASPPPARERHDAQGRTRALSRETRSSKKGGRSADGGAAVLSEGYARNAGPPAAHQTQQAFAAADGSTQ